MSKLTIESNVDIKIKYFNHPRKRVFNNIIINKEEFTQGLVQTKKSKHGLVDTYKIIIVFKDCELIFPSRNTIEECIGIRDNIVDAIKYDQDFIKIMFSDESVKIK